MSHEDITELVNIEDIAEVLGKHDLKIDLEVGLDFANALLYHLEEALEVHFSRLGMCQCITPLQVADLKRGYCTNCFGAITMKVSGKAIGK